MNSAFSNFVQPDDTVQSNVPSQNKRVRLRTRPFLPSKITWIALYIAITSCGAAFVVWPLLARHICLSTLHQPYGWFFRHYFMLILLEVILATLTLIITRVPVLQGSYATREATAELFLILQSSLLSGLVLYEFLSVRFISKRVPAASTVEILITAGSILLCLLLRRRHQGVGLLGNIARRNVLIAGVDPIGWELRDYLRSLPNSLFCFSGFVTLDDDLDVLSSSEKEDVVGEIHEVMALAKSMFVDEIIFSRRPVTPNTLSKVVEQASSLGIDVRLIPSFSEPIGDRLEVQYIGDLPTIIIEPKTDRSASLSVKRTSDVIIASIGIVAILPLCLIIAIAIKLQTVGPLFYTSKRVGYKGKIFDCYKFRTMIENAASMHSQVAHLNERDGILFKIAADPRITEVGLFLRKYSLDELPQLWNVLKGDMSLVGPRPSISSEVAQYKTTHLQRLDVVPGITGLWQVEARHDPPFAR
jgi:exopolysaccharide biosynthesis polyprenyl glycosylphosphotransferase